MTNREGQDMSKRNIIISVVLACLLVTGAGFGAFYYWGTHHLDSVVPGKVYQYSSTLNGEVNNRVMYVAFQEGGNKALVSQDRTTVVNAAKSQTDFDKAYNDQTAKWEYSVTKTTLTLGKKEDDQLSQWQYNKVFAYGDHFTSKDFYYQIAKGGQVKSTKNDLQRINKCLNMTRFIRFGTKCSKPFSIFKTRIIFS